MAMRTNKSGNEDNKVSRASTLVMAGLFAIATGVGTMSLTGCNTTKGVGEDIESLGDSISDEADDAQN